MDQNPRRPELAAAAAKSMEGVFDRTFSLEGRRRWREEAIKAGARGSYALQPTPVLSFPSSTLFFSILLFPSSLSAHLPLLLCLFAPHAHDLTSL